MSGAAPSAGLLAFTESAQKAGRAGKPLKKSSKPGASSAKRNAGATRHKGKTAAIDFDEAARAEYLTGFQKRKAARKEAGREFLRKKAKEEQLATRREAREAKKLKAAENAKADRRALGLPSDSEGEGEGDDGDDHDHDDPRDQASRVPQLLDQTYDTDHHLTQVVVEDYDPEEEEKKQEQQHARIIAMSKVAQQPKATQLGESPSSVEVLPPSSAKANKANAKPGQEEEEPHPDPSKNEPYPNQKRLHISGLTEAFTAEELKQRFSTFGNVISLDEWPGPRDGLGQLRPFAYLTIEATGPQVSRCINLLNNSMWKGTKLRVGEAKPDFRKRRLVELEKLKEAEKNKPAKRKRLPSHIGIEVTNMDPVTPQRVKEGLWGWKRTPAGHLIRPLHIRPQHPLPKPQPLKTKDGEKVKGARRPRANAVPPTRSKRVTIDPTRYGAVHITGSMLDGLSTTAFDVTKLGPGEWECDEIHDEDEPSDAGTQPRKPSQLGISTRLVRWRYNGKDGKTLHEEFTRLPVHRTVAPMPESASSSTAALRPSQQPSLAAAPDSVADEDDDDLEVGSIGSASDADSDLFSGFPTSVSAAPVADPSSQELPSENTSAPARSTDTSQLALGNAQTRMQSLTEMFRPQEDDASGKGFSLMGVLGDDLDLELDDELDFAVDDGDERVGEEQDPLETMASMAGAAAAAGVSARGPHAWFDPDPDIPFLFPSGKSRSRSILDKLKEPEMTPLIVATTRAAAAGMPGSMTGANALPVSSHWVGYQVFCRTQTEEELEELWASRRVKLTKEYKKMHREAVRKKKRRFVGSRRATAVAAARGEGQVVGEHGGTDDAVGARSAA